MNQRGQRGSDLRRSLCLYAFNVVRVAIGLLLGLALIGPACAQLPDVTSTPPESEGPLTMFPHPVDSRLWISGQMNFIYQAHPSFSAQYSGPKSFGPSAQSATGRVLTLYTGVQLNRSTEVLFDVEEAGGLGISSALG